MKHLQTIEASTTRVASLVVGSVRPALKIAAVAAYYDEKTGRLLKRYGPGPRVHYHTGLYADEKASLASMAEPELRRRMVAAQEAIVYDSLEAWDLTGRLANKRVLDCGCGLGGTSLLLASAGAKVTAEQIAALPGNAEQAELGAIADALSGVTSMSTKVAEAIKSGEIQLVFKTQKEIAEAHGAGTVGATIREAMDVPVTRSGDVPLSVVVHEGVHALRSAGKIMTGNVSEAVEEFAAHHYESEFLSKVTSTAKRSAQSIWDTVEELYEEEGHTRPNPEETE